MPRRPATKPAYVQPPPYPLRLPPELREQVEAVQRLLREEQQIEVSFNEVVLMLVRRGLAAESAEDACRAAHHQMMAAFGIIRSHATEEHIQHYQRAMMLCEGIVVRRGLAARGE